jgi:hypothetical protein
MVKFDLQAGRRDQQGFEHDIQARGEAASQRVRQTPEQGRLAGTQELVEDQRLATRTQHPRDFAEALRRVGNDCQDQVQYCDIETSCGKRQVLSISPDRREVDMAGTRDGVAQHGMGEVEADVMVAVWQVRQVETGADSRQQDAARRFR